MKKNRYEQGLEQLIKVDGEAGERVINSLEDIAPDLSKYIMEFVFCDIYKRKGLTLEEMQISTLSSLLTTGGCEAQLDVHIHAALNIGMTPEKIVEIFIHCLPFAGFPKVLNAIFVAKKIFNEKNISLNLK